MPARQPPSVPGISLPGPRRYHLRLGSPHAGKLMLGIAVRNRRVQRLFSPSAIPGWLVLACQAVGRLSNIDFIVSARGNRTMTSWGRTLCIGSMWPSAISISSACMLTASTPTRVSSRWLCVT
jgi:hypothetical protein